MHQTHVHRNPSTSTERVARLHKKKLFLTLLEQTEALLQTQKKLHSLAATEAVSPHTSLPKATLPSLSGNLPDTSIDIPSPSSKTFTQNTTTASHRSLEFSTDSHLSTYPSEPIHFESEAHAPFEQEPIYPLDTFSSCEPVATKRSNPPPDFQSALKQLPPDLQSSFEQILHAKIIGIWPIRPDSLKKSTERTNTGL